MIICSKINFFITDIYVKINRKNLNLYIKVLTKKEYYDKLRNILEKAKNKKI